MIAVINGLPLNGEEVTFCRKGFSSMSRKAVQPAFREISEKSASKYMSVPEGKVLASNSAQNAVRDDATVSIIPNLRPRQLVNRRIDKTAKATAPLE